MITPEIVNAEREGQFQAAVDVPLTVVITDLGGTTAAEVWVGSARAAAFRTHTRHTETALETANQVLASALAPLIHNAAREQGLTLYDPTAGDDQY